MSFHKLDKARDKNFWSIRVGSNIHKTTGSLLLCYVDHHHLKLQPTQNHYKPDMTTIHYTGSQTDPTEREALIRELSACAKSMDWGTIDVDDADAGLVGIILQPSNALEPIPFLFDAEGRLHALGDLLAPGGEPIYYVAVKTHYAGTVAHQWFTRFLRHIKDTFMPGLTVTDESEYWEHQDEAKLKAYFARLDRLAKNLLDHLTHDVAPAPEAGLDNLINCITLAAEMAHRQERLSK